ncbi:MAG: hypothetical protein R3B48_05705 [Kofleriaceae bacterium]
MTRAALLVGLGVWAAAAVSAGDEARAQPSPPETPIPTVVERSRLEVAPAGRAFVNLSVENALGDVSIEGHDGTALVIETRKRAPDDASLDRLRVSLVPGLDGSVRISTAVDTTGTDRALSKSAARIDLVIRAPRDLRFAARVGSGQLEVSGMDAGGDVDAASGTITMRNIGGATNARSISGAVTLSEMFGPVDAQTINAPVKLDTIAGESLVTSAHRGAILARRVRARRIELMTTTGDVELEGELALAGKVVVSSLRGNITVRLRGRGAMAVRAMGQKVDLGTTKTRVVKGVTMAELGSGDEIAGIDLRTRHGVVAFAVNF